jgi:hypothetical protein
MPQSAWGAEQPGGKHTRRVQAERQRTAKLQDRAQGKTNPVTTKDVQQRHQTSSGSGGRSIISRLRGR